MLLTRKHKARIDFIAGKVKKYYGEFKDLRAKIDTYAPVTAGEAFALVTAENELLCASEELSAITHMVEGLDD